MYLAGNEKISLPTADKSGFYFVFSITDLVVRERPDRTVFKSTIASSCPGDYSHGVLSTKNSKLHVLHRETINMYVHT